MWLPVLTGPLGAALVLALLLPEAAGAQAVKLNAPLAAGADVDTFAFTPDGNWVVYHASLATGGFGLHRVTPGGGASVLRGVAARRDFDFTPDGTRLVYHRSTAFPFSELEIVPLVTGPPTPLAAGLGGTARRAFRFRVVPDGSRVVYHGDVDGDAVLELASVPALGGAATRLSVPLSAPENLVEFFDFGSDGAHLLYGAGYDYDGYIVTELHSASVANGADVLLWRTDTDCPLFEICDDLLEAKISSNAGRAVFAVFDGLFSVPVLGGTLTPLGPATAEFRLSPDGGRVLYFSSGLFSVPIVGGVATQLTPAGAIVDSALLVFSAEGSDVFYQARHPGDPGLELWRVPITGGAPIRVSGTLGPNGRVRGAAATPDGSRVLFAADRDVDELHEVYSVPATGGAVAKLSPPMVAGGDSFSVVATPDSLHAVFIADAEADEVRELYVARVDGASRRKLNGPLVAGGDVAAFRLSPDGSRLVYLADQEQNDTFELFGAGLRFQCNDGTDNDGDGLVDHPADPGCESETGAWELGAPPPACGLGPELAGVLMLIAAASRRT